MNISDDPITRKPSTLLADLLGEVILEQQGKAVFDTVEDLRRGSIQHRNSGDADLLLKLRNSIEALDIETAEHVIHAFSLFFHLANIAEEQNNLAHRNSVIASGEDWHGSFKQSFAELKEKGYGYEDVCKLLADLRYRPVFTAHPTEAKRPEILRALRRIQEDYALLERLDDDSSDYHSRLRTIKNDIQILWKTETVRPQRPSVYDEIEHTLHYFGDTIFNAIAHTYRDIETSLSDVFHCSAENVELSHLIQFGSWVGGDRDGNPNVTAEITQFALNKQKSIILAEYIRRVDELARLFTHSSDRIRISASLQKQIDKYLDLDQNADLERYLDQPLRIRLLQIKHRLQLTAKRERREQNKRRKDRRRDYTDVASFRNDISEIAENLVANNENDLANGQIRDLLWLTDSCGFHLTKLDLRQEASIHTQAVAEIASNASKPFDYNSLAEEAKQSWLLEHIADTQAFAFDRQQISLQTAEVLEVLALIPRMRALISADCFGSYIISMAANASDILAVLFLTKIAGAMRYAKDGTPQATIPIAPLFETVADLETAKESLDQLYGAPLYRQILQQQEDQQEVMLGYSDSCKDGGILASSWNLFLAQKRIVSIGDQHDVHTLLFHGRGGTIGRGGGPTHDAIKSQPNNTVRGRIKFTEQGEVLSFKYNFLESARFELTVGITGLMQASIPDHQASIDDESAAMMQRLTEDGENKFRWLTDDNPALMRYFYETTPSKQIAQLNIGSRPSHRRAVDYSKKSIRAIGWVFGWSQCRQNLPGWFGLGSALNKALDNEDDQQLLQHMYQHWGYFHNLISNASMVLAKTDQSVASAYTELASNSEEAASIYATLYEEFEASVASLRRITGESDLMYDYPATGASVEWRKAYLDPLNYLQVALLKRMGDEESTDDSPWLKPILHSINGIATGLRNTG